MSRWFRFYDMVVDDPKVQKLPPALFKFWINCLCLASKNEGILPKLEDMEFTLRMPQKQLSANIGKLKLLGLLDEIDEQYEPHNWSTRQYKSDVSTDRVKRFRKRNETVSGNGPDQSRTDTEQKKQISKDFLVGGGSKSEMTSENKLALFQRWLATSIGRDGWTIVGEAANPEADGFEKALTFCRDHAKKHGKGWPHQWPSR